MASALTKIQEDYAYGADMSLEACLTYGWEYTNIEWRLHIEDVLPVVITEINQSVKAHRADHVLDLLWSYQDLKLAFAHLLFEQKSSDANPWQVIL